MKSLLDLVNAYGYIWMMNGMEIHAFGASGCSIQDPTKNNAIHVYPWCKAPDGRSFFAVYLQSALEVWLPVKQMDFFVWKFCGRSVQFQYIPGGDVCWWELKTTRFTMSTFFQLHPRKLTNVPFIQGLFQEETHLPTIIFQGICSFSWGIARPARCCVNLPFVCNASWYPRGNKLW